MGAYRTCKTNGSIGENNANLTLKSDLNGYLYKALIDNKGGYVNLRQEPSRQAKVIRQMQNRETVYVLTKVNADWVYVRSGQVEGFCMVKFLNNFGDVGKLVQMKEMQKAELFEKIRILDEEIKKLVGGDNA